MASTITVVRYQRNKLLNDPTSPMVTALKRKPGTTTVFDIERLACEIEELGGMSAEDVVHVARGIVRNMKRKLTDGFSVKLDGFGLFYTTFHCQSCEKPEDCTVKNIDRVNIRFKADSSIRLTNDANATTRGSANNVIYTLESSTTTGGGGSTGGGSENPFG